MRAARCRQAMESGVAGGRIYPRYPRYPQVKCSWIGADFVTAKGRGRDRLPATGDSLPSHSPSRAASRLTRCEAAERRAGRLTKPPPGGRWRACPSAEAKAAGFVKRPSVSQLPSGRRETVSGGEDLRVQHPAGRKRDLGQRAATGGTPGFGPRILRAGPGFGPGAAKPADLGLRLMARQAEPRLRPRILPDAEPGLRLSAPRRREAGRKFQICRAANRQGFGPVGEPAGKPEGASALDGPRRKRRPSPRFRRRRLETAQRGTPRLPG